MISRRLFRILKWSAGIGVTGSGLAVLHSHDWDISSTGIVRFGRAAAVISTIVLDYKKTFRYLEEDSKEYDKLRSQVHLRSAQKLHDLCCLNGGCFIKVGQHLGSLDYLLPQEYVDTLKVLHKDAPQACLDDVYAVIKEELGQSAEDIFTHFDTSPIGAASLAQVHKATLPDGKVVAVKVQHRRVKSHANVDMFSMEVLFKIVGVLFKEFQFMWLAEETRKNLPLELDFYNEAKNCERVGHMLHKCAFLKIPKIHWDLTTERVLTMEYCEGGQVNDLQYMRDHRISVHDVASKLGKLYSEMIFVHGYVHCDPHPGNILVNKSRKGTEIVLLDHGIYQSLTDDFRLTYCKLWLSLINADVNGIREQAERLGTGRLYPLFACMVTARTWRAVTTGIDKKKHTADEDVEIKANAGKFLVQISELLNNVPRPMLLIFKTNDLLRGIESTLGCRASAGSFITMSRCCIRALHAHERPLLEGWLARVWLSCRLQWALLKVDLYALWLWMQALTRRTVTPNKLI